MGEETGGGRESLGSQDLNSGGGRTHPTVILVLGRREQGSGDALVWTPVESFTLPHQTSGHSGAFVPSGEQTKGRVLTIDPLRGPTSSIL